MNSLIYVLAFALLIIWAVAFFGLHAGNFIHILFIVAFISIVFRAVVGKEGV